MFNRPFEKELLNEEIWLLGQQSKMPPHLQKLVYQEVGRQDIWELPKEESSHPHHVQNHKLKPFWILGLRF